jgi:transcriptional regulator
MRGEPLKGHLDMLLLAIVDSGATHGYGIIERLREVSRGTFDLPDGTIYPALHRLERAGYLKSAWTVGEGRKRRVYQLTASGRRTLARQRSDWSQFERGVRAVLAAAPR